MNNFNDKLLINNEERQSIAIRILLTLLVSSFIALNNTSLSTWGVLLLTILILFIFLVKNKFVVQIVFTKFHLSILCFALLCGMSQLWVENSSRAITVLLILLKILICVSIIFLVYQNKKGIEDLLDAIMWSGPIIGLYAIAYYGLTHLILMLQNSSRFENTFANSNAIGMWMALSIVIFLHKTIKEGWKWTYLSIIIPIIMMILSQSRTSFVELIFGAFLVVLFSFKNNKDSTKKIIKTIFVIITVVIFARVLISLPIFSAVNKRMETVISIITGSGDIDTSTLRREEMIEAGWESFLNNPLIGSGVGSTYMISMEATGKYSYLHNNYIELLASLGIIGFILYYSIHVILLVKLKKLFDKGIRNAEICIVAILMFMVADFGTVSYYSKGTFFVFVTCYLLIYQNKQKEIGYVNKK